ncbi:Rnf14 [Phodopus roborovskii]|uniref:Rnf14 protein n=1 Tax=Phodopus roborovskii TaxID=109678 RepID=A0AAU9ZZJ0_PHORO|nr:Rnf14 [Phodopus roborovskii]
MSSEDLEAQEDELLALASIYDADEFRKAESVQGGETRIYLDLPQNFKIFVSALCSLQAPRQPVGRTPRQCGAVCLDAVS